MGTSDNYRAINDICQHVMESQTQQHDLHFMQNRVATHIQYIVDKVGAPTVCVYTLNSFFNRCLGLKVNILKCRVIRQLPHSVCERLHTTAESFLSVTLPTAIRETLCSLWGFTPPVVNLCVRTGLGDLVKWFKQQVFVQSKGQKKQTWRNSDHVNINCAKGAGAVQALTMT